MKSNEMERNMLMTNKDTILRILEIKPDRILVIDWYPLNKPTTTQDGLTVV